MGECDCFCISIVTCCRKDEAVAMLKRFYDGVNPNAPNPKVKGVRVNKVKSDVMDSKS